MILPGFEQRNSWIQYHDASQYATEESVLCLYPVNRRVHRAFDKAVQWPEGRQAYKVVELESRGLRPRPRGSQGADCKNN